MTLIVIYKTSIIMTPKNIVDIQTDIENGNVKTFEINASFGCRKINFIFKRTAIGR